MAVILYIAGNSLDMTNEPLYIYYAEDDEEDRLLFRESIQECCQNIILIEFTNGESLVKCLNSRNDTQTPCAIVSDMKMPYMDGLDVLRAVKNNSKLQHLPVIILSTSSSSFDKDLCKDLGATAFFSKPTTLKQIRQTVEDIIHICLQICNMQSTGSGILK